MLPEALRGWSPPERVRAPLGAVRAHEYAPGAIRLPAGMCVGLGVKVQQLQPQLIGGAAVVLVDDAHRMWLDHPELSKGVEEAQGRPAGTIRAVSRTPGPCPPGAISPAAISAASAVVHKSEAAGARGGVARRLCGVVQLEDRYVQRMMAPGSEAGRTRCGRAGAIPARSRATASPHRRLPAAGASAFGAAGPRAPSDAGQPVAPYPRPPAGGLERLLGQQQKPSRCAWHRSSRVSGSWGGYWRLTRALCLWTAVQNVSAGGAAIGRRIEGDHARRIKLRRDPLDTNRSHGCIRLANTAIDWLVHTIGHTRPTTRPTHPDRLAERNTMIERDRRHADRHDRRLPRQRQAHPARTTATFSSPSCVPSRGGPGEIRMLFSLTEFEGTRARRLVRRHQDRARARHRTPLRMEALRDRHRRGLGREGVPDVRMDDPRRGSRYTAWTSLRTPRTGSRPERDKSQFRTAAGSRLPARQRTRPGAPRSAGPSQSG